VDGADARRDNFEESVMGAKSRKWNPSEVFDIIKRARQNHVPIVPLIGAGLSLEAGIPTTRLMIDYMAKVKLLIDLGHRKDDEYLDYAKLLKSGGWPDPDEINDLILVGLQKRLADTEDDRKWLGDLAHPDSDLVRTSGSVLGAVVPFMLHEYLQEAQPNLLGFMPSSGRCPSMSAMAENLAAGKIWDRVLMHAVEAAWAILMSPPSDDELREKLEKALGATSKDLRGKLEGAIRAEFKPTGVRARILRKLELDWRAMLRLLTSGIPSLVDSFFARVLRGHKPAVGHQLLGLMAETFGARLWLTTNFDDLIERALRDQSIYPDVYELPDSGPAPDASLFRSGPAVVKLHGSGFALRVGESLDTPLDRPNLDLFKAYFPNDAIVLVIGYGGGDRRVMSLIEQLVIDHDWNPQTRLPKVIWVHRGAPAPRVLERVAKVKGEEERGHESIVTVRYRSGGLFLREMYEQLTESHPASRVTYDALPMLPPFRAADRADRKGHGDADDCRSGEKRTEGQDQPEARSGVGEALLDSPAVVASDDPEYLDYSVALIYGREAGCGTSTSLVNRVNALSATHQVIWCDLAEIANLESLVDILLNEFRRLDPGLMPFGELPPVREDEGSYEESLILWLARRLATAMRRGKYVVALDAAGEFGRHALAHHVWGVHDIDISSLRSERAVLGAANAGATEDPSDPYGTRKLYRALPPAGDLAGGEDLQTQILTLSQVDGAPIREVRRLYCFLDKLCEAARSDGQTGPGAEDGTVDTPSISCGLGESKLCVALSPLTAPEIVQKALDASVQLVKRLGSSSTTRPDDKLKNFTKDLKKAVKKVKDELGQVRGDLERFIESKRQCVREPLPRVVVLTPERLSPTIRRPEQLIARFDELLLRDGSRGADKAALLRLAAALRRARHVLAFKDLVKVCEWNGYETKSSRGTQRNSNTSKDRQVCHVGEGPDQGKDDFLLGLLQELSDNDDGASGASNSRDLFFSYQEGGFYKMHCRVRDSIYASFTLAAYRSARNRAQAEGRTEERPSLWRTHTAAADYYERLFMHSNSLPPLFESVYHRIAAHRFLSLCSAAKAGADADAKSDVDPRGLLSILYALLRRANKALLDGPSAQVLAWLKALQEEIELLPVKLQIKDHVVDELSGLRARVHSAAADDRGCFEVRIQQIKRLIGSEATGCDHLAEVQNWLKQRSERTDSDFQKTRLGIAEALKSAGESRAAIEIGWGGRRPVHFGEGETAEAYLEQARILGDALSRLDSEDPAHLDFFVQRAMKLTFHCNLSLADMALERAEQETQDGEVDDLICKVNQKCQAAEEILEEYSHRFPEYVPRDRAALSIRRARCGLLKARGTWDETLHREACLDLKDARAEAYVGRGEEDRELIAEIRLRTAQGLWNQASCLLSTWKRDVENDAGDPKVEVRIDQIRDFLNRTRVHLEQARSALSDGHSDFKRWYLWEQLRRRCDDLHLDLIEVLLKHTEGLLETIKTDRTEDRATLEHASVLLDRAHTALSISPPTSLVWDKWKARHETWTDLKEHSRALSDEFRLAPRPLKMNESQEGLSSFAPIHRGACTR
jgi:hypothetical protein